LAAPAGFLDVAFLAAGPSVAANSLAGPSLAAFSVEAPCLAAPVFAAVLLTAVFVAPSSVAATLAAAFLAAVFRAGAFSVTVPADVTSAGACPAGARFSVDAWGFVPPPAGAGLLPASVDAGVPAGAAAWCLFAPAAGARAVFTGLARPAATASARVVSLPPAPSAPPPEAAAPVERPDTGCCSAVFFATMAAAPSHIVILLANRAGTINRLESRGNGAHRPIRPPASPEQRTCNRCAQLPAG